MPILRNKNIRVFRKPKVYDGLRAWWALAENECYLNYWIFCEKNILYDYLVFLYDEIRNENMWFNDSLFIFSKTSRKTNQIVNTIYFLLAFIQPFLDMNYCKSGFETWTWQQ